MLCPVTFFFENRAVYQDMRKKYGTARPAACGNTMRRMAFAGLITVLQTHANNV
jgi:hypothetical protein